MQRFPVTFVVKSLESRDQIREAIRRQAVAKYKVDTIVSSYMNAIEDIINVHDLVAAFREVVNANNLKIVMDEIIAQSKVEFNYNDGD